jgi:DNA adenine methylase
VSRSALAVRARGLSLPREAASPTPTQPVLKWPGGKRKIAGLIVRFFPAKFERYFEPFFGGGALFFMLQPKSAVLSDVNQKLMDAYIAMRDETEAVIGALSRMPNGEEAYYRIRAASPSTKHVAAARMIYLCTYSFNGIYRENRKGEYNVPYGQKIGHRKPTPATLRRAAMALRGCTLSAGDFGATTVGAKKDDLVYFDPPYTLKHSNNGFVKYNASLFTWADQERLAKTARNLAARGVHVAVSNASHSAVRALYPTFREVKIERHSVIAADATKRARVSESLFLSSMNR